MRKRYYLINRRVELGYTQEKIAEQLDISREYYCMIENGKKGRRMDAHLIERILKVFNFTFEDFFKMENEYSNKDPTKKKTSSISETG